MGGLIMTKGKKRKRREAKGRKRRRGEREGHADYVHASSFTHE
jgi:hypothetical protein